MTIKTKLTFEKVIGLADEIFVTVRPNPADPFDSVKQIRVTAGEVWQAYTDSDTANETTELQTHAELSPCESTHDYSMTFYNPETDKPIAFLAINWVRDNGGGLFSRQRFLKEGLTQDMLNELFGSGESSWGVLKTLYIDNRCCCFC